MEGLSRLMGPSHCQERYVIELGRAFHVLMQLGLDRLDERVR